MNLKLVSLKNFQYILFLLWYATMRVEYNRYLYRLMAVELI